MSHPQKQGYLFVIYPKCIIIKGIYSKASLPSFTLTLTKNTPQNSDHTKEDQIVVVPERQQQLYQTYFLFNSHKLTFKQQLNHFHQWCSRSLSISDSSENLGSLDLNIQEYIENYEEFGTKYYDEQSSIGRSIQFQFDIFVGFSESEISDIIYEIRGESIIKTPLTSFLTNEYDIDKMQAGSRILSQIYSPKVMARKPLKEEDEEDDGSLHSSIPLTSPVKRGFSINLTAVPLKDTKPAVEQSSIQEYSKMLLKDKLTICLFGLISLIMIYFSMLPIRKI